VNAAGAIAAARPCAGRRVRNDRDSNAAPHDRKTSVAQLRGRNIQRWIMAIGFIPAARSESRDTAGQK